MAKEKNRITVHTARTIMFRELSKVMDHALQDNRYIDSLKENIANKLTKTNQKRTDSALISLYKFDESHLPFVCFKYFWQVVEEYDKSIITMLYAISNDYLFSESIEVIGSTSIGDKVSKQRLEENIETFNPNQFTKNTVSSAARNLISSWKQVGYISNNNLAARINCTHSFNTVAFAFLMAYLSGERGEFILSSKWVRILSMSEAQIRQLAAEAAIRDIMEYKFAGSVSVISFNNLFNKLKINV